MQKNPFPSLKEQAQSIRQELNLDQKQKQEYEKLLDYIDECEKKYTRNNSSRLLDNTKTLTDIVNNIISIIMKFLENSG